MTLRIEILPFLLALVAGQPGSYHVPVAADPDPGPEIDAWKAIEQAHGVGSWSAEGALVAAARDLARDLAPAASTGGEAGAGTAGLDVDMDAVFAALLGWGVSDRIVHAFAASAATGDGAVDAWRKHVEERPEAFAGRSIGIGAAEAGGRWTLAAVAVRRGVDLSPVPRSIEAGETIELGGKVAAGITGIEVVVALPGGDVRSEATSMSGDVVSSRIALDGGEGAYAIEVLGDTGHGPEVLNLFPVTAGKPGGVAKVVLSVGWRDSMARNAWMLFDLVNAGRGQAGLPELAPDAALAAAALAHSRDMREAGFFGHVSPTMGGVDQRVIGKIPGLASAAEAIALAKTPQRAYANLVGSPAHAAILKDPGMDRMGVGKVKTQDGMLFTVILAAGKD